MQVKYNHSEHSRTHSKNPIMPQTCQRFIPKGIVPSGSVFETNNQIILHETSCDEIWHRAKRIVGLSADTRISFQKRCCCAIFSQLVNPWEWLTPNISLQFHRWIKHYGHENEWNYHQLWNILLLSKFFLIVAQELKRELMHASVRVERLKVGLSSVLNNDDLKWYQ